MGGVGRGVRACVGKAVGCAGGGLCELPVPRSGGRSGKGRKRSAVRRGGRMSETVSTGPKPQKTTMEGRRAVCVGPPDRGVEFSVEFSHTIFRARVAAGRCVLLLA